MKEQEKLYDFEKPLFHSGFHSREKMRSGVAKGNFVYIPIRTLNGCRKVTRQMNTSSNRVAVVEERVVLYSFQEKLTVLRR